MKRTYCALAISFLLLGCHNDNQKDTTPYHVGMQRFTITYDSELAVTNPELAKALRVYDSPERKLMVKIWYPAKVDSTTQSPIHYGFHTTDVPLVYDASLLMWAEQFYQHEIDAYQQYQKPSRTYLNAAPIKKRFPVVIHSHGMGMELESDQFYFESLAEQGYLVVSVAHTIETPLATVDENRHIAQNDDYGLRWSLPAPELVPEKVITLDERVELAAYSIDEYAPEALVNKYQYTDYHNNLIVTELRGVRRDDVSAVYTQLKHLNNGDTPSNLAGLFDLDKVAASGFSLGGTTALQLCEIADNCLASVNFDGPQSLNEHDIITKPHLYVQNTESLDEFPEPSRTIFQTSAINEVHSLKEASQSELDIMRLADSKHRSFTRAWFPALSEGIDRESQQRLLHREVIDYFNYHLKGHSSAVFCDLSTSEGSVTPLYSNHCD